jgi:hypothetical protein
MANGHGSIATAKWSNTPDAEQSSIVVASRHILQMLRKNFNCQKTYIAVLSSYSVLPNGEYYISCAVLQLQIHEEFFFHCYEAYIADADTKHYRSITKQRILYKLRIAVANCVYCRC